MPSADVIITKAKVFTSDDSNPHAEAVAIRGNRIIYVGTETGAQSLRNPSTRTIDGQGHTLTPGFIDSHVHLLWGAIWMGNAQLQEVRTKDELKNALADFAPGNTTTPWVLGRGIRYGIVSTRQELDNILADRPIYIGAFDGHTGWANIRALEMAGMLNRRKWSADDPDQRLTLEECILGYTRDAAYTEFMENQKGQVKEGYLADLVLFSHDLFEVQPEKITSAKAVMTMVDGRIVYEDNHC